MSGSTFSVTSIVMNSGIVIQLILLVLVIMSIWVWSIILQKRKQIKVLRQNDFDFSEKFFSGTDIESLYQDARKENSVGLKAIFYDGFGEFKRLKFKYKITGNPLIDGAERAMRLKSLNSIGEIEEKISTLGIIGSIAPYIGLLGTVWGIMASFTALGGETQAALSMVAPHIAEALIATALGLFVAIVAVVSYNRFAVIVENMQKDYDNFQDEIVIILHRESFTEL